MNIRTAFASCLALLLATVSLPASAQFGGQPALSGTARVVDGDTLAFGKQRVRLSGVDAPEKSQTCYRKADNAESAWPCGQAAGQALSDLIAGNPVTCQSSQIDRYGRFIGKCSVTHQGRTVDLGGALVWNGWALAYTQYSKEYVGEQAQAKAAGRGIWSSRWQSPEDYRRSKKN